VRLRELHHAAVRTCAAPADKPLMQALSAVSAPLRHDHVCNGRCGRPARRHV